MSHKMCTWLYNIVLRIIVINDVLMVIISYIRLNYELDTDSLQ